MLYYFEKRCINKIIIAALFVFIFLNYFFRFEGPVKGYWDTYLTVPALFIANQPVNFISKDGEKLYTYSLPGRLPENLVNNKAYGISSKDQRLGSAIIFAPWFLFFNIFGFRLFFAVSGVLIGLFVFLTTQELSKNFSICTFSALCATLNSYILSITNLNPNILGMMLISILLYLLIRKDPNGFIAGLICGVLGGIRNEGVLFFPAIVYKLSASHDKKIRQILLFILGTLITIVPILYWNYYAFGNPFMHPTQFHGLGGFRPEFEHRLLFWKFNFNGMLNYPFYIKIIRTPYFSFPVFLLLPLTLINSFGIILSVLIFTGAVNIFKKHRQLFIFLIVWFTPMYILLSVQENWSELKTTFLLLWLNPLILFMSLGLEKFFINVKKDISKILFLSIILIIAVKLLFYLDFGIDQRWYIRFPRAIKGTNFSYVGDDLRTKFEAPSELIAQKKNLTQGNIFPWMSANVMLIPYKLSIIKEEINQKDITTVDFWKYIYEK